MYHNWVSLPIRFHCFLATYDTTNVLVKTSILSRLLSPYGSNWIWIDSVWYAYCGHGPIYFKSVFDPVRFPKLNCWVIRGVSSESTAKSTFDSLLKVFVSLLLLLNRKRGSSSVRSTFRNMSIFHVDKLKWTLVFWDRNWVPKSCP